MTDTNLIIDFDSTFVSVEGLEELAKISLAEDSEKKKTIKKISEITNLGMEGKIPFNESLRRRLKLLRAKRSHVKKLAQDLRGKINPSVFENKEFLQKYRNSIYIISGGFKDFIFSVIDDVGLKQENVIANSFIYSQNGDVLGADETNPLSRAKGKAEAIRTQGHKGRTVVIGDGWTDYEIKKEGLADCFMAFTRYARRGQVINSADFVINDFNKVIKILNKINN